MRQRDAAQKGGRGKPGGVPDDTAPECDDGAAAVRIGADEGVVNLGDRLQVLETLAVRQQDRVDRAERVLDLVASPNLQRVKAVLGYVGRYSAVAK